MTERRIYRLARTGATYRVALFERDELKAIVTSQKSFEDAEAKL